MRTRVLGSLAIGLTATTAFGSEDVLAPVDQAHWYHQEITEDVARVAGWSAGAAAELGLHAVGVDLYSYHGIWAAYGGPSRLRGARMAKKFLDNVHFDNLASTSEITEIWRRTLGGALVGIEWAARQDQVQAARQLVGVSLHSIQDFYSHSTWIDEPARRSRGWLEQDGVDPGPGLSTGGYGTTTTASPYRHGDTKATWRSLTRLPAMLRVPLFSTIRPTSRKPASPDRHPHHPPPGLRYGPTAGINLDSRWQAQIAVGARRAEGLDGDAAFDLAIAQARRESQLWLERLDERFGTDPTTAQFWARVRGGPQADWTCPYNDPTIAAYGFIAIGQYPPNDSTDAARWCHRVLLRPPLRRVPRWPARGQLHVLDAQGRQLSSTPLPPGQAVFIGPTPAAGVQLEINVKGGGQIQAHAFRRAPEPVLRLLIDGSFDSSTLRLPLEGPE
jgi:hypothetical protein